MLESYHHEHSVSTSINNKTGIQLLHINIPCLRLCCYTNKMLEKNTTQPFSWLILIVCIYLYTTSSYITCPFLKLYLVLRYKYNTGKPFKCFHKRLAFRPLINKRTKWPWDAHQSWVYDDDSQRKVLELFPKCIWSYIMEWAMVGVNSHPT